MKASFSTTKTSSLIPARALAGLMLLSAIVLLTVVQAAQAAQVQGTGAGSGTSTGQSGPPSERLALQGAGTTVVLSADEVAAAPVEASIRPAVTGPYALRMAPPGRFALSNVGPGGGTALAQSSPSSGSIWVALAAFAGGLGIVVRALARNRIRRRQVTFDCEASLLGC